MTQYLRKRSRAATVRALSLMMMMMTLLLTHECSGNPIEIIDPPPPAPSHTVEIAGIMAYYEEAQSYRDLGIVINEYEYDESSSMLGTSGGRRIVRQSVCYDVKMEIEDPEDFDLVHKKICEERAKDKIINAEQFTIPMIQQVVRDLKVSGQPIYRYQIDDGHDLLDFDIQFMPYDAENKTENKISEKVTARRPEWKCTEQISRLFQCLWEPDDADRRIIKGLL